MLSSSGKDLKGGAGGKTSLLAESEEPEQELVELLGEWLEDEESLSDSNSTSGGGGGENTDDTTGDD